MSGEFDLITRYLKPLVTTASGALGLTDDAALIDPSPGFQTVVTTDTLVAGIHFLASDPPQTVARKLLAVNLSDLAAMAAQPDVHTLSLALPQSLYQDADWLVAFAAGLAAGQQQFASQLIGGDTVATPGPLTLTITAIGKVPQGRAVRRSGACRGDVVYVSGTIGDAYLGLRRLEDSSKSGTVGVLDEDPLVMRYRCPTPRLALGQRLAGLASAMIDVSDGLVADLGHVCRASGVTATLDGGRIPLSAAARRQLAEGRGRLEDLLCGGDDYELLFCAPPQVTDAIEAAAQDSDTPVTAIGIVDTADTSDWRASQTTPVIVHDAQGLPLALPRTGYQHFC